MIDIHCHIIPGVDDGVPTIEEALRLIRREVEGGTDVFIATPHFVDSADFKKLEDIADQTRMLSEAVSNAGIKAQIYPGGEIYPSHLAIDAINAGQQLTLAGKGRHMLVDLPMTSLPRDFDQILFEIQSKNIVPILAHPERCGVFQERPELLESYIERGIACQVNARSLVGKYGPRAVEVAWIILRRRWAHFLASDAHRASKLPILGTARMILANELGETYVELITRQSADCVVRGVDLPERPVVEVKEREHKWFTRLLGR